MAYNSEHKATVASTAPGQFDCANSQQGSVANDVWLQYLACLQKTVWILSRNSYKKFYAQTSRASERWDNRWGRLQHYKKCSASEKPNVQA